MQKRIGRSCGKVSCSTNIRGPCASAIALNPRYSEWWFCFVLFVFVEFNGRRAKKATVMTCWRSLFLCSMFCMSPYFPTSPPALCRYLPLLRVVLSVKQQLFSSCFFIRAAASSRFLFRIVLAVLQVSVCSSSVRMVFILQSFLIGLHPLRSSELSTCCINCLICLVKLFLFFFSCFLPFFVVWLVLCVFVPGRVAFHLLYLSL